MTAQGTALRFGYGTNGLADLRLDDALALLADLGYDGVGLTLDHMHLDPLAPDLAARTRRVGRRLAALGLDVTVETGARYVLDPRRKHGPSLLDPDPEARARRVDLLLRAVRVAADLGAHAVHCFSGTVPPSSGAAAGGAATGGAPASGALTSGAPTGDAPASDVATGDAVTGDVATSDAPVGDPATSDAATGDAATAWQRLAASLTPVLEAADTAGIPLAIEPEPGHLLATLADFHHLRRLLGDPPALGLTLDLGHCQCLEPLPPADCVRAAAPWLRHVQIEDMRRGVHDHLPFGEGEMDFPPVLAALAATGYQGLTVVELPRHSHAGPHYAEASLPFLHRAAAAAAATVPLTAVSGAAPGAASDAAAPAAAAPATDTPAATAPATPTPVPEGSTP
ncbi:sugar phosphate isomerase/epimerase family protein [Streptomyces milbemycinicus]|uniref:Sugar phosphate isomerase/epimerase family protein n=1 Tax=Streptomyces milbemycinicus TaxID=476552 RepID=A0ABW8LER5_9ACTN